MRVKHLLQITAIKLFKETPTLINNKIITNV